MRVALGLAYLGTHYHGWQSQPDGCTVQDHVERALTQFVGTPVGTVCAGRTDAGVHALMQVVHFDTDVERSSVSWVRGSNRYLPADIAVQWATPVTPAFHARASASSRRYRYVVLESPVRPALETARAGWVFRPLDPHAMRLAAAHLLGRHDFTSFRAAACQAPSPIKTLTRLDVAQHGAYWTFDFEADAFLHHMIRNIMGCLLAVGQGTRPPDWMAEVREARRRDVAAPTFAPDGLYFLGPRYPAQWQLPERTPAFDWLPG